jgi:hypothetical protein
LLKDGDPIDAKQTMPGPLKTAVSQRLKGEKPTAPRALAGATAAGAATGVVVYKLLRR